MMKGVNGSEKVGKLLCVTTRKLWLVIDCCSFILVCYHLISTGKELCGICYSSF